MPFWTLHAAQHTTILVSDKGRDARVGRCTAEKIEKGREQSCRAGREVMEEVRRDVARRIALLCARVSTVYDGIFRSGKLYPSLPLANARTFPTIGSRGCLWEL